MIFFILTMFNLFLQKTKKIIESRGYENESSTNSKIVQKENRTSYSGNVDVPLKELVYGWYRSHIMRI